MKNTILAIATFFGLTTAAAAEGTLLPVPVIGSVDYAFEADIATMGLGTELAFGAITITPMINGSYKSGLAFTGAELTATYLVTDTVDVYATVESDADWEYSELTLGLSFRF